MEAEAGAEADRSGRRRADEERKRSAWPSSRAAQQPYCARLQRDAAEGSNARRRADRRAVGRLGANVLTLQWPRPKPCGWPRPSGPLAEAHRRGAPARASRGRAEAECRGAKLTRSASPPPRRTASRSPGPGPAAGRLRSRASPRLAAVTAPPPRTRAAPPRPPLRHWCWWRTTRRWCASRPAACSRSTTTRLFCQRRARRRAADAGQCARCGHHRRRDAGHGRLRADAAYSRRSAHRAPAGDHDHRRRRPPPRPGGRRSASACCWANPIRKMR